MPPAEPAEGQAIPDGAPEPDPAPASAEPAADAAVAPAPAEPAEPGDAPAPSDPAAELPVAASVEAAEGAADAPPGRLRQARARVLRFAPVVFTLLVFGGGATVGILAATGQLTAPPTGGGGSDLLVPAGMPVVEAPASVRTLADALTGGDQEILASIVADEPRQALAGAMSILGDVAGAQLGETVGNDRHTATAIQILGVDPEGNAIGLDLIVITQDGVITVFR